LIPLCLAVGGLPLAYGQSPKDDVVTRVDYAYDTTLLKRITEKTLVHEPTLVAYTIPEGWKAMPPHRLERTIDKRISSKLEIEDTKRDMVASLYWIQMTQTQNLSEFIRDKPAPTTGEYGEEYETLKAVYGKDRVTVPTKLKQGPFEVYRTYIYGGPERGEKYDGTLFVFEVDREGKRWLVKARVSFPKGERGVNDGYATEVLLGYSLVPPEKLGSEPGKITGLDENKK
jgi:hypothetical protein